MVSIKTMSWINGNVVRRLCIQQVHQHSQPLRRTHQTSISKFTPTTNNQTTRQIVMRNSLENTKHYLLASDFDQTLSFNDSGIVLSEVLGTSGFGEKVAGLSTINLVQQGGELAYLLLHDPEYRCVRKEHLIETGKRIRLKANLELLLQALERGVEGQRFLFYVISAAPEEVIQSALEGIVPRERIFGTRFNYSPENGEIQTIAHVAAGYGKVAVLDKLQARLQISPDHIVYVGDG